jgi:hypothetical protein
MANLSARSHAFGVRIYSFLKRLNACGVDSSGKAVFLID